MPKKEIAAGVAYKVSADLRQALASSSVVRDAWNDITPLGRKKKVPGAKW